jgi:signal transduction histidine kinase
MAAAKGIEIRREMTATIDQVDLDRQKFIQVLYNLLSNAVKFSNEGSEVSISATRHDGALEVSVRDWGIGILREDLEKLFVEFQQLDSGSARRFQGTGLGLALTKKLVEVQGGSIAVESERGRGSKFTIRLPLAAEKRLAV